MAFLKSRWLWAGFSCHVIAVAIFISLLDFNTLFSLAWANGIDGPTPLFDFFLWTMRITIPAGFACYGMAFGKNKMSWSITGFNPRRVAWMLAVLSLLLVPIHFYVPCDASAIVMMLGVALLFLTGFLEMADRSGKKAGPFWLALIGVLAHILCTH